MKITDKSVRDEQGASRKERGCVDQILALSVIVENDLEKYMILLAAFMDLKKVCDRVHKKFIG